MGSHLSYSCSSFRPSFVSSENSLLIHLLSDLNNEEALGELDLKERWAGSARPPAHRSHGRPNQRPFSHFFFFGPQNESSSEHT